MTNYKYLLKLAHKAIKSKLDNKELNISEDMKKKYSEKKASFVTLTENGELRGCIGSLYPKRELYKDVAENAIHAAFNDPRFPQLEKNELPKIKIEVSVLSLPKKINFENETELLKKIDSKMGIILKKDFHSATFLPQVWEQISDKIDFLEELSMKAGLGKDAWKNSDIYYYTVEKIGE